MPSPLSLPTPTLGMNTPNSEGSPTVFGSAFGSSLSVAEYANGEWRKPQFLPMQELSASPAWCALHYGQIAFEGLKAFSDTDGWKIFRADRHHARLVRSCERLIMPPPPWEHFLESLAQTLVGIPTEDAVYLRPFVTAWDAFLGVRAATHYRLFTLACPASSYFKPGSDGLHLRTETQHVRACIGGTGDIKTPGNYAASLAAAAQAKQEGYSDVVWLDSRDRRYVEEAGAMNIFFRIGDTLVTPALQGSILAGVTRESVIAIAKELGYSVEERPVSVEEISQAHLSGNLLEAFGTGTAAGIVPIARIDHLGEALFKTKLDLSNSWTLTLRDQLKSIQGGVMHQDWGWRFHTK